MPKSKIEEFFAIEGTIEYYRRNRNDALAIVEQADIPTKFISGSDESRIDALELACAIIALAE